MSEKVSADFLKGKTIEAVKDNYGDLTLFFTDGNYVSIVSNVNHDLEIYKPETDKRG